MRLLGLSLFGNKRRHYYGGLLFSPRWYNTEYDKTFDKILIANRGEIACRVIKTARKMGIKSVAIYSEADANALHVEMADEAVCVGPPPTSASYLNIEAILGAIKQTGAQAVHPGYGFLSENAHFSAALREAKVTFIGPSAESIEKMGDKIASKKIAKEAGVHTIPGFDGVVKDAEHAVAIAKSIGYPVMLKASAGGGGKGMRIAWNDHEVKENFRIAAAESKASFGDDRLLVEKFIEEPRHVEIQLIGDQHGKTLYLPERECSIQRRNQKVIEEAPSVAITPDKRRQMGEQAVQLAKAVGYYSAGTVEFLVDKHRNFYFLEMNTRLQVEHPITELITGLDLVEQMIRVAAGQPLSLDQDQIGIKGWAVESRVYAEDPQYYLPCIGSLSRYREPEPVAGRVRCDSGIKEGSEISIYYDPMICKLSTHGATRDEALDTMTSALDRYVIRGVTNNISLLRDVVNDGRFREGRFSTAFLAEQYPHGFPGHELTEEEAPLLAVLAAGVYWRKAGWDASINGVDGGRIVKKSPLHVTLPGGSFLVSPGEASNEYHVTLDQKSSDQGKTVKLDLEWAKPADSIIRASISNGSGGCEPANILAQFHESPVPSRLVLQAFGTRYNITLRTPLQESLSKIVEAGRQASSSTAAALKAHQILSPMPGTIVSVRVKPGDLVRQGSEVLVVEAMKMQNVLRASHPARVKQVLVREGETVSAEQVLIEFEDIKE